MQFHERLKGYRKEMGLTQEELAKKIHVSRSAVAKWENGLGLPSDDSLDAIAVFFEVNREELLADRETETIIVEKNGKLSRQKACLIGLIILASILLIVSAIILGVFLTRETNDKTDDGNGTIVGDDEEITAEGIVKSNVYTWFDINKTDLPTREACREISVGMSLNQVIRTIGKPQRDFGYGAWILQFDLADGSIFTVTFVLDLEKMESKPRLSTYDYLIVKNMDYDKRIPDVYFPYCGYLNAFYPWIDEMNVEDIVKVRYEHAYNGVAPGALKDISYSTNNVDIENAYNLLFRPLTAITTEEGQIVGGAYVQYDFFTADNAYSIYVSNNTVLINNQYYQFVDTFYYAFQYSDLDCYSFDTFVPAFDEYEIYTYANESVKVGEYVGLSEFEFYVYGGLIENTPQFYLRSCVVVNLLILSDKLFMIEHDNNTIVYQITSEKDFSELFAKNNG